MKDKFIFSSLAKQYHHKRFPYFFSALFQFSRNPAAFCSAPSIARTPEKLTPEACILETAAALVKTPALSGGLLADNIQYCLKTSAYVPLRLSRTRVWLQLFPIYKLPVFRHFSRTCGGAEHTSSGFLRKLACQEKIWESFVVVLLHQNFGEYKLIYHLKRILCLAELFGIACYFLKLG